MMAKQLNVKRKLYLSLKLAQANVAIADCTRQELLILLF